MKKILAFLIAVLIFVPAIFLIQDTKEEQSKMPETAKKVEERKPLQTNNPLYRLKVDIASRDRSYYAIAENLAKTTMPVFGSSEFRHSTGAKTHPAKLFRGSNVDLMLLGAAYNQSLFYGTLTGAIDKDLTNRKVVLILSYNWFRDPNVYPSHFALRFSKTQYLQFMKNNTVSFENKKYVGERTEEILSDLNNDQYKFVKSVNKIYLTKDASVDDKINIESDDKILKEQEYAQIKQSFGDLGIKINEKEPVGKEKTFQWDKLEADAKKSQESKATNNDYGMENDVWLDEAKSKLNQNVPADEVFHIDSKEFNDLECFLKICKDCKIKPMILFQAINGKYFDDYDNEGEGQEIRTQIVDKTRELSKQYNAEFVDFSQYNYTKYFLKDRTHPSQYGWEKYNEAIYKFYKEN